MSHVTCDTSFNDYYIIRELLDLTGSGIHYLNHLIRWGGLCIGVQCLNIGKKIILDRSQQRNALEFLNVCPMSIKKIRVMYIDLLRTVYLTINNAVRT